MLDSPDPAPERPVNEVDVEIDDPWIVRVGHFDNQDGEEALDDLRAIIAAGDIDGAVTIMRSRWHTIFSGDFEKSRRVLQLIPASERNQHPVVLLMLAITALPSRLRRPNAIRYFLHANRVASAQEKAGVINPLDRALLLVGEAAVYRFIKIGSRPAVAAYEAAEALRAIDAGQLEELGGVPILFAQVGRSLLTLGDVDAALSMFEDGLALIPLSTPPTGYSNAAMLAGLHAIRGEIHLAREYVDLIRSAPWPDHERTGYPGVNYLLAEAVLALEGFDHRAALNQLARMDVDHRTIEDWVDIAQVNAAIGLISDDPREALASLEQTSQLRRRDAKASQARSTLAPARALLELAIGSASRAAFVLGRDAEAESIPHRIGLARAALSSNAVGDALRILRSLDLESASPRLQFEAAVLEVAALLRAHTASRGEPQEHSTHQEHAIHKLGGLASHSGQRYALGLLTQQDFERVLNALGEHGYGHLYEGIPARHLLKNPDALVGLTERERIVFLGLANGLSISQIAAEQYLSANTIKTQVRSIYKKLGVSTREEVAAFASSLGLR